MQIPRDHKRGVYGETECYLTAPTIKDRLTCITYGGTGAAAQELPSQHCISYTDAKLQDRSCKIAETHAVWFCASTQITPRSRNTL